MWKKQIVPTKTVMAEQLPAERVKNFDEVPHGYTPEQAIAEAQRCLQSGLLGPVGSPRCRSPRADWKANRERPLLRLELLSEYCSYGPCCRMSRFCQTRAPAPLTPHSRQGSRGSLAVHR